MAQAQGVRLGMTFLDGSNIQEHRQAAGAAKQGATELDALRVRHLVDLVAALSALPTSLWEIGPEPDGTKACVIADASGRAVAFSLAPGQAHELSQAIGLLDRLPSVPR